MDIAKVYPLDAVFDNLEDVPEDVTSSVLLSVFVRLGCKVNEYITDF